MSDSPYDFNPVPAAARHDGWTPERQRRFIAELASHGGIAAAARAVGMTPQGARQLRKRAGLRAGFNGAFAVADTNSVLALPSVTFATANPPRHGEGDRSRSEWWRGFRSGFAARIGTPSVTRLSQRATPPSRGGITHKPQLTLNFRAPVVVVTTAFGHYLADF